MAARSPTQFPLLSQTLTSLLSLQTPCPLPVLRRPPRRQHIQTRLPRIMADPDILRIHRAASPTSLSALTTSGAPTSPGHRTLSRPPALHRSPLPRRPSLATSHLPPPPPLPDQELHCLQITENQQRSSNKEALSKASPPSSPSISSIHPKKAATRQRLSKTFPTLDLYYAMHRSYGISVVRSSTPLTSSPPVDILNCRRCSSPLLQSRRLLQPLPRYWSKGCLAVPASHPRPLLLPGSPRHRHLPKCRPPPSNLLPLSLYPPMKPTQDNLPRSA